MEHFLLLPADFSFVCPTELEALQDNYEAFKQANAEIYSVSEDTEFVHKAWAEASEKIGKIKYHMLADPAGKLARMFDVLNEDEGQAYRGVFIVDPDGKIQSYTINNMGIVVPPRRFCGRCRRLSLFVSMATNSAQPTGSQVRIRLSQVWIWSASFNDCR